MADSTTAGDRDSLHARVTTALRDKIVDGVLRPGTPVSERALCEELAVSRTPLREALKVLASESLVNLFPGRGAIVSHVSVETIDAKFAVLAALEGLAAALVCRHASDAELDRLVALHRAMKASLREGDNPAYFAQNQRFHSAIVEACGNPVLMDQQASLARHVKRARFEAVLQHVDLHAAAVEHDGIVKALKERDADRARQLMEQHVLDVGASVVGHFRGASGLAAA